jgi:hypothetical protein
MRNASLVLIALLVASCTPAASPSSATQTLEVRVVAGPVCPVETQPPDPGCEPRPVVGAPIVVSSADGRNAVVAQDVSDADGIVRLALPPGSYIVTGGEVEGLMGLPPPTPVKVATTAVFVTLAYDTGIR